MLIGDMLNVVGGLPFKQFEWGEALVSLFNERLTEHIVSDTQLLTVENTGEDARSVLYRLPAVDLAGFITLDFDPGSHTVSQHEQPATPVAGIPETPMVRVGPYPVPKPMLVDPVTGFHADPPKLKSRLAIFVSGSLVVIALILAVSMSATSVESGEMPDSKALETVVSILGDVIKAYLGSPDTPPTPPAE